MRVDRTFRNWIYVNKMRTAFQLDLCQQDRNTLSIGLLSTRCEQVELFSTGLKSTRCEQVKLFSTVLMLKRCKQPFNWNYINKMRTASQLDIYQQNSNSFSIGLISTKMRTASQLDAYQQDSKNLSI